MKFVVSKWKLIWILNFKLKLITLQIALFVVIAVAYASAEETIIEKEIEKVPLKVFPPGVDPL